MKYRNTIITGIITLAVAGAALMTLSPQNNIGTKRKETTTPDAYMENVVAVIHDKFGKVTMRIVTPKMTHFAQGDTTEFIDPQLTIYHKSPNPWYIASKIARAWHGIDNVIFTDNVTIHHPADYHNPATMIKTTSLTVHPNEKTAETVEPITMIQPNSIMKAIGMQADMDSGNIKLLSQAQGEYVPDS